MSDVFISYSTLDSKYAFRIYSDLLRSGAKVYLYEREGEIGINFREEIYSKIEQSIAICLIDSTNSRKSKWVREECQYAVKQINQNKLKLRIIPCIIEQKGEWFFINEHFSGQSAIRGIDFSDSDYLDYKEKYKKAILELCEILKVTYRPWSDLPTERDFEKEISIISLSAEDKVFLTNDYNNFLYSGIKNSATQLFRIKNLIDVCNENNINILSCYLALGAIYANNNQDIEALNVFKNASIKFPNDARIWSAISGAHFYLSAYQDSLEAIDKSLLIINQYPDNEYLQCHKAEIIYNKIIILIKLNDFEKASKLLLQIDTHSSLPEYLIASINIKLMTSKNDFNSDYIKLKTNFYDFDLNSKYLNSIIADIEFKLGYHFTEISNLIIALEHFGFARSLFPQNIQYQAQYFLILKCLNELKIKELNQSLIILNPDNASDYYYLGLLYYLKGDCEKSVIYYNQSNKFDWPKYNNLIEYD